MLTIYIDADACPVKEEVLRVADRHKLDVFLVSNSWMLMPVGPQVQKIVVSEGADAADDWIVEHIEEGDLVITSDIPLASRALKKNAYALGPTGKAFTPNNVGTAMAMRELNSHLRETGASACYNPSFTKQDRSSFLRAIEEVIQKAKRDFKNK